jgi:hypothetical protein
MKKNKETVYSSCGTFLISKEAVAAERRYEKEIRSVKVNACKLHLEQGRICSLLSLPPPPSHPPPINEIRVASCVYFLSPPLLTHIPPIAEFV